MKRLLLFVIATLMVLSLTACKNDTVLTKQTESEVTSNVANIPDHLISLPNTDDNINEADAPTHTNAEFYGSFLTMARDVQNDLDDAYFQVIENFAQIQEFYDAGSEYYIYGKSLTITLASFDEEYMADHDLLILVINEPSTYITHDNASIDIENGKAVFNISRLIIEHATMSDTCYHLIFTSVKGAFDGLKDLAPTVNITETVTNEHSAANDAERYQYSYPEFWPFSYKTPAVDAPATAIDVIQSYDSLIAFYEQYKGSYNLDTLKQHIGPLYDEALFDDYVLLIIMVPYDSSKKMPEIEQLFVYNLEIYILVENSSDAVISDTTSCCLLVTAIAKSGLQGVDLSLFNISFE